MVFLMTTPASEMAGRIEVGLIAGRHIFGESGARIVAGLISLGLVSTVSALMWIGPRVTLAMGEDNRLLQPFAVVSANGAPTRAILLQAMVATLLLWFQSFEAVLDFIQFSLTFCSFLAVLGLIVLRWRRPDLPRPYRVWAYPLPPVIFLMVMLFMLSYLVVERPQQVLSSVAVMAAGLVIYAVAHGLGMTERDAR
jgi:APA family basic amino acid/polyamine antiporter